MVDSIASISYSSSGFSGVTSVVLLLFWKEYHFFYHPRVLYVIGLMVSRSLTNYSITSVLAWYLANYDDPLVILTILSNIQTSLSSLLVIFMAHAADLYVGRFLTIVFSNIAYLGGLLLLWLFDPYDVKWLVIISLVLISLGTSGDNILDDALKDVVNHLDKPQDQIEEQDRIEERSLDRAKSWSRIAYALGAISSFLWVSVDAVAIGAVHPSWRTSLIICMIAILMTLMIFTGGLNHYHQGKLTERPSQIVFRLVRVLFMKLFKYIMSWCCCMRFSRQDKFPKGLETENRGNEVITQKIKEPGENTSDDMVKIKSLSRMIPMWMMFFVVSIISATGSTFFLMQYTNLNTSKQIPIQIYSIAQDFSGFAIPLLYSQSKYLSKNERLKIGVGMVCGIISCIFAWRLEVYRLKEVGYLVDKDLNTSISFLWLMPQFCVLGCMEGFTQEGVLNFYKLQMKKQPELVSYGEEYVEIVMGLGSLMNILLIFIFQRRTRWFGDTINDSRLDKYYLVLVFVCFANLIVYCLIASCRYRVQDSANNDLEQEQDNQAMANNDQEQDNKFDQ